jgi:outer membrane protein assembly factor BamB
VKGSPIVNGGYVYITSYNGYIYQLNATNISQVIHSYYEGNEVFSSIAIANGYAYVGTKWTDEVLQLNANNISQLISSYSTGSGVGNFIHSSPAIANGMLYIAADNGKIYQLNADNVSQLITIFDTGFGYEYATISSPAVANGYIYVGMSDGKLYQLNATNISLPNPAPPAPPFDITSVFCSSPVSPVESSTVNYTIGANVTSDEVPSVMMTLTLEGSVYNSSSCTYQNISGNNRTFTCEVLFQYYYAPGAYDVSAFFATSNETKNLTSAAACTYNELLAVVKDRQIVTFSAPIIGYNNVSIDVPISISNTGNANITSALLTAYDIPGTIIPSYKLFASYFRAGSDLGSSTQLANGVQKNVTFTLNPGVNSTIDFYLWVSVPSDQYPQQYISTIPWQLILE